MFTNGELFMEITLNMPEGVQISKEGDTLNVKGPKGIARKVFRHPRVALDVSDKITISTSSKARKDKAVMGTWVAHMKNLLIGVENGYEYKMKIIFTHFPMIVKQENDIIIIANFMGEKGTRTARVVGDTEVKIEKEYITLSGPAKEDVSQSAANVEQACRKKKKDLRVFHDGIYIASKG